VEGDAARLAQLLDNLLSNAIKYSPRGGIVEVSLERCDARACLRVRDTGPGISHAEQERIFERFTRASGAAHGATGGVGLGLAIAAAIAAAHDGQIGVDSLPGTGSTFWVSLDAISACSVVEAAGTD
jgi:two-component system OmpR family sensor kinase